MKVKLNGVQLACLVDTGSHVTTLAKPVFDVYLSTMVRPEHTYWVNLKTANKSAIQTLGVVQVDMEIWNWVIWNKGVVLVQEVMDSQAPVILGINVLIDQQLPHENSL